MAAITQYLIKNGAVQSGYTFTATTTTTGTIEGVNIAFTMRGFDSNSVSSNYRRLRENVVSYANREGAYYLNSNISFSGWSKLRCTFYATHNATDGTGRYCRVYIYKNTASYLDSGTKGTNYQYVQAGTSSSTKDISLTSTLISNCNRISICVATSYADVSGYIKDLWLERDAATYTITYKANGGTGSDVTDTKTEGVTLQLKGSNTFSRSSTTNYTVTINANGGTSTVTSRTATKTTPYTLSSWNTASGGGGTSYSPGGNYTANAAAILYAQWTAGTATTTSVTLPTTSQCTRTGWTLLGFSTSSTATAADSGLTPGANYTPTGNKILYAVWRCTLKIYYHVNNGSITTGTGTTRYRAGNDGLVERSTDSGSTWADYYSTMYNYDTVKDLVNVATFGITRTGYYITGTTAWRTSGGTIISQESTSASDTNAATIARLTGSASLSGDTSITLYVNWTSYTLTINFNVNGGSITTGTGTTRYRVNNDLVQVSENSGSTWSNLCNYLTNDEAYKNLWNVGTYGATKSGYDIVGNRAYRTGASSGNYINQDTASASDVNAATMTNLTGSSILTADTTITLYINWEISQTVFVKVYINSEWKDAIPYVYISGVWKQATPNLRIGSIWKN